MNKTNDPEISNSALLWSVAYEIIMRELFKLKYFISVLYK